MRALTKLLAVLLASSLAVSAQTDLSKEPTLGEGVRALLEILLTASTP